MNTINEPKKDKKKFETGPFLRDIIFGCNDAILTNLGVVAGFTTALKDPHFIIIACLVDIFISAFAMSFGTYMSRTSEHDFLKTKLDEDSMTNTADAMGHPVIASVVMFFTYIISGFIPLLPILLGLEPGLALKVALVVGISTFFFLGLIKGAITKTSLIRSGTQFLAFGTVSAVVGLVVGQLANHIK